jgi:raffinose/stachyose/melibiose transport system permease protein
MQPSLSSRSISYAIIFAMLILYMGPLLMVFNVSFKTLAEFFTEPFGLAKSLLFSNYADAWQMGNFSVYIWNSLLYTGVSTILTVFLSLVAAFPISRGYIRWAGFFYIFFVMSMFLPNPLVPQFKLMLSLDLYNTQSGYILLRTQGIGIVFLMFVGYIKSISRELDEAAGMDGCGYSRFMFQIVIPLMKPIIATGVILTAIGTWNDIMGPVMYLSDNKLWPITAGLMNFYGQYGNNWPLLSCGILIVAGPLMLLYVFIQRYIVDGALEGAIK